MKRTHLSVLLAGLLALALTACGSLGWKNPFGSGSNATPPPATSTDTARTPANGAPPGDHN